MKNLLDQLKTHKKQAIATGAGIIGLCLALVLIVVGFPAMPDTGTDNNWNQNALEATTSTDSDNNKDQVTTKTINKKRRPWVALKTIKTNKLLPPLPLIRQTANRMVHRLTSKAQQTKSSRYFRKQER